MYPRKVIDRKPYINTPTKPKPKKGHNAAKILRMITNIELHLYFTVI